MTRKLKRTILLVGASLVLVLPSQAAAQQATQAPYDLNEVTVVESGGSGEPFDPAEPGASGDGGGLPFTGLDLALLGLAGTGLVALGLGMRRLTRRPDPA